MWRASRSGVTHSVTAPATDETFVGLSPFRVGAKHSLDADILVDSLGLHIRVFHPPELGGTTVATQLGTIRALLMAEDGPAIGSPFSAACQSAAGGQMILIVKVTHADIMARLISIKLQVEGLKRSKVRMVFEGASEAHLLAAEIAKADIGVIVAPSRPFPYSSEYSRCLPGVPFSNDTLVSTLWRAGVVRFLFFSFFGNLHYAADHRHRGS